VKPLLLLPDGSGHKVTMEEVYSWASNLTWESRLPPWEKFGYVWPDEVKRIAQRLEVMRGGMVCLVGLQGVGKSSALSAIHNMRKSDSVFFKWRRPKELYRRLENGSHEESESFAREWRKRSEVGHPSAQIDPEAVWLDVLRRKRIILIDTPDYSKTDRRAVARDLHDVYWLWLNLMQVHARPNVVLAIQKEMFGGHFFLDKMEKIELQPLQPKQLLSAYTRWFDSTEPFTEDALLTLARMSRGVFRRFLKYITLSMDHLQAQYEDHKLVDTSVVREAVTLECLTEDAEFELAEVFPRQSDAPRQAVRLLMELEEHGPLKQGELGERLGIEDYSLSRLLAKLELHRYVRRERSGTDKIVALART
jgi:hypothetical protein